MTCTLKKNWNGRQVRHVLKAWYNLDHHFDRLTLNGLKYMEQFYFRMSYLSPKEQALLAELFYHPMEQQPRLTEVVKAKDLDYLKFNYAVHKLERKLMKYRQSPNLSKSMVGTLQFRQLADAFHSIINVLQKKFTKYPQIKRLDQADDEDFGMYKEWSRNKVERVLSSWCRVVKRPPKHQQCQISLVRQLIFRLSYLPKVNYMILRQYYYYPTRQQQRAIHSEHLAQDDNIYLGTLLLHRLHGLEALRQPRYLPKMSFTDDERWQIHNDRQTIRAILDRAFQR